MTTGSLRGRRVLVSGAAGFIGAHLVARLAVEGADVVAMTRETCDLTDRGAVSAAVRGCGAELFVHLAAARDGADASARAATSTVNALSGSWIVDALPDSCEVVVRLGSSTEYAAWPGPMDESVPVAPRGFFGATKAAGSLLLVASAAERAMRSCVLRAFQVYGSGDKPTRFVPAVLDAARTGAVLPLTAPGRCRDWVHVDDVVEACLLAATREELPTGTVLNVGTGTQTSNEALVDLAAAVTGRSIRTAVGAHPGRDWDTSSWVADPTAARDRLDWKPEVDLADGLARCWAALR